MSYSSLNGTAISAVNLGLKPDGVTDNKTALQSAINSLYSQRNNTLFFPKGTYYWSGVVDITGNNLNFFGEEGSILLAATAENDKKINISGASNITFNNLTFDSNGNMAAGVSNQNGFINTIRASNITIQNSKFYNPRNSSIYLGDGTQFVNINNNYFTGYFCAIYSYVNNSINQSSNNFLIDANLFNETSYNTFLAESAAIKLQADPSSTGFSSNHIISNNSINAKTQIAIELWTRGRNNIVVGNTVSNSQWGISLDNQTNASVIGNLVKGVDYLGFEAATACRDCSFVGNVCDGYSGESMTRITNSAFSISNTTNNNIIVSNNIIKGSENYGINVQSVDNTVIANNVFQDNFVNLFYQGASQTSLTDNLFISTGTNRTAYHIQIDMTVKNCSGYHFSNNKFQGVTTDQSIYWYNDVNNYKLTNFCIENNFTDTTCSGGYDNFCYGSFTPSNYTFRNNFGPSGGAAYNTIIDASDSTSPYKSTDILNGFTYYGSTTWPIPNSGITGNGIWLCVWSGGVGTQNNVRINAANYFNQADNQYNGYEFWATMNPYTGFFSAHTLYASPPATVATPTYIQTIKTISNEETTRNSIWLKISPIASSASGQLFYFKYSLANALSAPFATYTEPTNTLNNAILNLNNAVASNAEKAYKFSNGITVGSSCNVGIYSPTSGTFDFWGALYSPFVYDHQNVDTSSYLKSGLSFTAYTSIGTTPSINSTDDLNSFLKTGVTFTSGGWTPNIDGYSLGQDNYAMEFNGYFWATGNGVYSFGVNADNGGDMFVDGKMAAYWYGAHGTGVGPGGTQNTIYLNSGYHTFRARYYESVGGDGLQCLFKSPSDASYRAIPRELFLSDSTQYIYNDISRSGSNLSLWGNLGIKYASPTFSLSLGKTTTTKLLGLYDDAATNTFYGMGIANANFRLFAGSGGRFSFGCISSSNGTGQSEFVNIDTNSRVVSITGSLGFGTASPSAAISLGTSNLVTKGVLVYDDPSSKIYYGMGVNPGNLQIFSASGQKTSIGGIDFNNGTGWKESVTVDNANNRLGINVAAPAYNLHVSGTVGLAGISTATTAVAGGATLPANPVGFITINITGSNFKIPYYNV